MAQAAGWKRKSVAPANRVGKCLAMALILYGLLLLVAEISAFRNTPSSSTDWASRFRKQPNSTTTVRPSTATLYKSGTERSVKCHCDICAETNYTCVTDGVCFTSTSLNRKTGAIVHAYRCLERELLYPSDNPTLCQHARPLNDTFVGECCNNYNLCNRDLKPILHVYNKTDIPKQQQTQMARDLIIPVPNIIKQLVRLMSASMQQLDTAFRPSQTFAEDGTATVSSPLIEYPQDFRTTLWQISHWLSDAFMTANTNVEEIKTSIPSMNETVQLLFRNSSRSFSSSRLRNSTVKNVQLASEVVDKIVSVANLTKSVVDIVTNVFVGKKKQLGITLEKESQVKANLRKVNEDILELNGTEYKNLKRQVTETNVAAYNKLEEISQMWHDLKNKNPCIAYQLKSSSIFREDCNNQPVSDVHLYDIVSRINQSSWLDWSSQMQLLNEKDFELSEKREQRQNLILDMKIVEKEKQRLDDDIQLLNNSKNPLDEMDKELSKLVFAWRNFTLHCSHIRSHAKNMTNVDSAGKKDSNRTKTSRPTAATVIKKKMEEDMQLLEILTDMFVRFYDKTLASLLADAEKMTTVYSVEPTQLEREILSASTAAVEQATILIKTSLLQEARPENFIINIKGMFIKLQLLLFPVYHVTLLFPSSTYK